MQRTVISLQLDLVCAGIVMVFNPRLYSRPFSSTSLTMAASATRLFGQTFFSLTSSWRIRPSEFSSRSPASNSRESVQPSMVMSTGSGQSSGMMGMSHSTSISGDGKFTTLFSLSLYSTDSLTSTMPLQGPMCSTVKRNTAPSLCVTPNSSISHCTVFASIIRAVPFVGDDRDVILKQGEILSVRTISVAPGFEIFRARFSKRSSSSASSGVMAT